MQQFNYEADDIVDYPLDALEEAKVIAALILAESEHPGLLSHVLRIVALTMASFEFHSSCRSPEQSIIAQRQLVDFLFRE